VYTELLTGNKNVFIIDEIVTLNRFNGNLSSADRQLHFLKSFLTFVLFTYCACCTVRCFVCIVSCLVCIVSCLVCIVVVVLSVSLLVV